MKLIRLQKEGAVAQVIFNRPDVLNAINEEMLQDFHDQLVALADDREVKVIVVKGTGRAFSAGIDLKSTTAAMFQDQDEGSFMALGLTIRDLIREMPKVVIGQVHGYCFTGALELAMFFDLLFCDENTQFGDTHAKWSIIPRWGMSQNLARRVGILKAKELTFRAMRINGIEAARIGLVNTAFSADNLEQEVQTIANEISANSFEAIIKIKRLYDDGWHTTLAEGLRIELETDTSLTATDDQIDQFESKKFSDK